MSQPTDSLSADLPLPLLCRLNDLCNRFEADWRAGRRPRIEAYLAELDVAERPAVLRHLLPLDADYRRSQGEFLAADDYLARFPDLNRAWLVAALVDSCGPATWSQPPVVSKRESAHPTALGEYVLLSGIGAGGMGKVYRARHRRMGRDVALKVLPASAAENPNRVRRFRREVEAAAKLVHPNLVTAYDAGEDQGVPYLVSEYIDGTDLARLVQRDGPLPVATALDYTLQAARGLAHAHAQGVVHRDVKPANLMLDRQGVVRVLDVGLARLVRAAESEPDVLDDEATAPGVLLGTADYLAPEQARDPARADERADVYSLGCTLHYLLTGRPVFGGADVWERVHAHRERAVPSLRSARADVPNALDRVFRKMLAKDPARRQGSMADVIHDLEACRGRVSRPQAHWGFAVAALFGLVVVAGIGQWRPAGPPAADVAANRPNAEVVSLEAMPVADPARYQRRWAERLNRPVELTNEVGMRLALVPPGRFRMGSAEEELQVLLAAESDPVRRDRLRSETRREVTLEHAYYLGATEVTVGQFRKFVTETGHRTFAERLCNGYGLAGGSWVMRQGYRWDSVGDQPVTDDHPAFNVSWHDAVAFCDWLTGRSPTGLVYRLPTEAEWEHACRAGRDGRWCFGNNPSELGRYAWFAGNSQGFVHPVGQKLPNAFGLYDMHGNRAEWCGGTSHDPGAPNGDRRLLRGGRLSGAPRNLRSAARDWDQSHASVGGFRVLGEVPQRP